MSMKNKNWLDYLSKEQINNMLKKAKEVSWAKCIKNESMLKEWTFHWYDDMFCGGYKPTEKEIKANFQEQYNEFMAL
jgi:hypothetical protein